MLLNTGKDTAFTVSELLRKNKQGGREITPPPPPTPSPRLWLKRMLRKNKVLSQETE